MTDALLVIDAEHNYVGTASAARWLDVGLVSLEGKVIAEAKIELSVAHEAFEMFANPLKRSSDYYIEVSSHDIERMLFEFVNEHASDLSDITAVVSSEFWITYLVLSRRAPEFLASVADRFINLDAAFRAERSHRMSVLPYGAELGVTGTVELTAKSFLHYVQLYQLFNQNEGSDEPNTFAGFASKINSIIV